MVCAPIFFCETYCMNLLLRLWWLEKRRNFKKKDVAIAIYFLTLYVFFVFGIFFGAKAGGAPGDGIDAKS